MSQIVLLDAGLVGLISNPKQSALSLSCALWLRSLLANRVRVILPEIADYEVRRELLRARKTKGLKKLEDLAGVLEYLPVSTAAIRRAAEFWAEARQRGKPTTSDDRIDADAILAGQAMALGAPHVVIATTNVKHLSRFAPADHWANITSIPMPTPDKDKTDKPAPEAARNFIHELVEEHNRTGRFQGRVVTRFPPEPNGYLHIGHAKSICLNFGTAAKYGGQCNLRFDDSNPTKEDVEYVESIMEDVRWLGFRWDGCYYASDYFDQIHDWAIQLIKAGKAFVCDLNADQMREYRGTLTTPGKNSPYRDRSVEENLELFERMRTGEFPDGARTLRAKVDMAHPNINMRDPVMYRILHAVHHHVGDKWCIYPTYDYTHGQSDSIEKITHSICTLEFENHRPLYDWYIQQLGIYAPQQIEFARLNLTYTVLSKRRLIQLVNEKHVSGWDDPRMPTICGYRRRGYTPEAIRNFCDRIGVSKYDGIIDMSWIEDSLREDLNKRAARVLAVLRPLKVVIDNYPEGQVEELEAVNNPEDPAAGTRKLPFARVLYIEQDDFREDPPKDFFRLGPGKEVRLRWAYFIKCVDVVKKDGQVVELHCTYDPATRGGNAPDGRKVKGTIHWVAADTSVPAEVRLYDHLFTKPDPNDVPEGQDYRANLNPASLEVLKDCRLEPSLKDAPIGSRFQFERLGYFCVDKDSKPGNLVFNRTVTLRDTWAKIEKGKKK